jgi:endo-1,4-beta-xylanase
MGLDGQDPIGNLTDEQALDIIQHCDAFKIRGMNGASGASVSTSFLLDDLRWLDRNAIPIDPNADSLRKYAANHHLYVGSWTRYDEVYNVADAKFAQILAQEFNLVLPETAGWFQNEPTEGVFDFSKTDALINFATNHHMAVFSFFGGWSNGLPDWLMNGNQHKSTTLSLPVLQSKLTNYIDTAGQRFKGKIAIWTVFNEVVNGAGNGFRNRQPGNPNDYSPWVNGGDTSLIEASFREARKTDPQATLILNDFSVEEMGWQKAEFFYNFVKKLLADGIPIDGVGFQFHGIYPPVFQNTPYESDRIMDLDTFLNNVDANIKRYHDLGLKVVFSEVDLSINITGIDLRTAAGQAELNQKLDYEAQFYGGLMKVALANPNVIAFNTMNFSDRYSDIHPNPDASAGQPV